MKNTEKPPMVVWLCGKETPTVASHIWDKEDIGPYVHLEQFMEEVERRAVKLFGKSFHNATMSECVSQSLKELAKEIMEGKG